MSQFSPDNSPICAVIGTGVIGRSWARLFVQAGLSTRLYDRSAEQLRRAVEWIEADLQDAVEKGRISPEECDQQRRLLGVVRTLDEALEGADYVQESGPEELERKQQIFRTLEQSADPLAILASSTSALDMTEIAAGLQTAERCIVAHPVNPPHLVPVVEVLGGEKTAEEVVGRTMSFLKAIGQTPVRLNFYLPGFLLNRMQAALVREAINLVRCGVADVDAVDAVIRDGLGLRWALFGPFGVANTNDDQGIRGYFTRFGKAYEALGQDLELRSDLPAELLAELGEGTDRMLRGASPSRCAKWRDEMVLAIRDLKRASPGPFDSPESEESRFPRLPR